MRLSDAKGRACEAQTRCAGGLPGALDVRAVREDFPILQSKSHGKPLVYLDNAATTQKPRAVIEAMRRFYEQDNANIHRGVYELSQRATDLYEGARRKVQRFVSARDPQEIIFTRGATESINLVAWSYGRSVLKPGDQVLITGMEHHSNIVPWQMVCRETGAELVAAPFDDTGELILEEYQRLLSERTKIVGVVHLSNSLGTINPVKRMVEMAHRCGARVLIDGAQWVAHGPTDVAELGCDFYVFSGHKVYGPTGIGVLYGRAELLDRMPPYQAGGDMIRSVTLEQTLYADVPQRFEAGTPNIAGAIGLGEALDYVSQVGLQAIWSHEQELLRYAERRLEEIPGLELIGTARQKGAVLSFVLKGIHPHDIGTILDGQGIAIRTGHHCCQPVMDRLGIPATARASLALYNTKDEIDALACGIRRVIEFFGE